MNLWEQIRDRISVREVAEGYGVELHGSKATCPWCSARLAMSVQVDFFKCHHAGCEARGDVFAYVALQERTDRWGAAKLLADHLGLSFVRTPEAEAREQRSESLKALAQRFSPLPTQAREYLHGRGLTDDYIERRLLGYVPQDYSGDSDPETGLPGLLRGRVLIPFWQGSQVVYFTGRAIDDREPKYCNQRGPKAYIGTMRGPELIVTEGIFDQLLADQAGHHCIGLAGSGATPKLHAGIRRVLLVMDRDAAGAAYEDRYGVEFYAQQDWGLEVEIATLPEGVKDLADYLQAGGKIEDLPHESVLDRYVVRLTAAPKDKPLKRTLYDLLRHADPIDREQAFVGLAKLLGCGVKAVRADYASVVKVELEAEYATPDGIRFRVPDGYRMNGHGIECGKAVLSHEPVIVDQVGTDKRSTEEYYRVRWGERGSAIMPRLALAKAQELLDWARYGFPVDSANAVGLVRFLSAWNAANRDKFSPFHVVSQLGWDEDQVVMPGRIVPVPSDERIHTYYVDHTIPADTYEPHGTLQGWVDTIKMLGQWPDAHVARFLLYAGAASIILEPLNRRPFIIHLHGDTSIGKSTALRIPASIYGNPTEGKSIVKWKNTENFIIRYMEKLKNLPLIIDESSAETRSIFESIIYQMESGIGKGKALRGDPHGTAALRTFRLGVFSSGEPPVLNENFLAGAQIRVMEFTGSPFGKTLEDKEFHAFNRGLSQHYGHAIDHFVRHFLTVRDELDWGLSPIKLDNLSPTEERMKHHLDLIWMVGELVNEIFNLGFSPADDVIRCFESLRDRLQDKVKMAEKLVSMINDHYHENQNSFPIVTQNTITKQNEAPIPHTGKVFGFVFGDDLGVLKTHFKEFISTQLGHQNAGEYAINILKSGKKIEDTREQRRINSKMISMVYFKRFFENDEF